MDTELEGLVNEVANSVQKKGMTSAKEKKFGFFARLKLVLTGFLVGAVLGGIGVVLFQHYNPVDVPDPNEELTASVVFERIQSQNELVCASQNYSITEKAASSNKIPFTDIPVIFTEHSYWYRYVGTIKVAVNLETAEFTTSGNAIAISLDQPCISSNTPDMDKSGVLEENNNVLNPITVKETDQFRKKCQEQSQSEALKGGIIEEAKISAEESISAMFNAALGDEYEVFFVWRTDKE